jgi:hypothetical protein
MVVSSGTRLETLNAPEDCIGLEQRLGVTVWAAPRSSTVSGAATSQSLAYKEALIITRMLILS